MHLVAIAWTFVVLMMAVAEAASPVGTVLGAAFTLLLYGVLPLALVLYIIGTPGRRRARRRAEAASAARGAWLPEINGPGPGTGDHGADSAAPDGCRHAAGPAVAAERKEP